MTTLTEGAHRGAHLVSEANNTRSREQITVLDGETLVAGQVLGKVTSSGKYVALDPDASDGSESAAGVLYDAVTASGADEQGVAHVRDCEVNLDELTFSGLSTAEQATAVTELAALGIICR